MAPRFDRLNFEFPPYSQCGRNPSRTCTSFPKMKSFCGDCTSQWPAPVPHASCRQMAWRRMRICSRRGYRKNDASRLRHAASRRWLTLEPTDGGRHGRARSPLCPVQVEGRLRWKCHAGEQGGLAVVGVEEDVHGRRGHVRHRHSQMRMIVILYDATTARQCCGSGQTRTGPRHPCQL